MPRTGIPGGRTGHDGPPSCLQMVITRGPGVRSAVPAPARLLVVVAAVALGRPRHPRPGQARSGASPPIRRLGLSAGARPPRRPPGSVGLAGMAWGMRRGVPGFKHGAFRAGWPSCPKLARPAPAHAPRPTRIPRGTLSCPCGAIHLVPPGKADRTGSAPVPQRGNSPCAARESGSDRIRACTPRAFPRLPGRLGHGRERCQDFSTSCGGVQLIAGRPHFFLFVAWFFPKTVP